jgi:predicted GNAT family acetyltransferase
MEFRKNTKRSRYELTDGGDVVAVADYVEREGVVVFPHTYVEPRRRGQGLAAELVRQALDDVRPSGRQIVASCWYVADFVEANPAYADLLAA